MCILSLLNNPPVGLVSTDVCRTDLRYILHSDLFSIFQCTVLSDVSRQYKKCNNTFSITIILCAFVYLFVLQGCSEEIVLRSKNTKTSFNPSSSSLMRVSRHINRRTYRNAASDGSRWTKNAQTHRHKCFSTSMWFVFELLLSPSCSEEFSFKIKSHRPSSNPRYHERGSQGLLYSLVPLFCGRQSNNSDLKSLHWSVVNSKGIIGQKG